MAIGVTFPLITGGVDLSIRTGLICYSLAGGYLITQKGMPVAGSEGGWFRNIFKITTAGGTKIPIGFLWMILIVIIMAFVLNHTKMGRYTIAIGSNKEATRLSGVNVKFYHVMAYVISGFFAALAAVAYSAVFSTVQPGTGAGFKLEAIGGAIIGGV